MSAINSRLATTLHTLASTANEASVPILLAALEVEDCATRNKVFRTLLSRHDESAENEVLRRWTSLGRYWQTEVTRREGWLCDAIRRALLGADENLRVQAAAAAVATHDYDCLPTLAALAADKAHAFGPQAAKTLIQLAEKLHEELAQPRDYRTRRDPQIQRSHAIGSLERAVQAFDQHGRQEVLEAFLVLAGREQPSLSKLLDEPGSRIFGPLMDILTSSPRLGVIRLLLGYLEDSFAPPAAIQAIARRTDVTFLRLLFRRIGLEASSMLLANLRRIENIPWLKPNLSLLDSLQDQEHAGALRFIVSSGIPRPVALEALVQTLGQGRAPCRRVAAALLAEFRGEEANAAALRAIEDEDPQVRATVAGQLRDRGVPGFLNILIGMLDSEFDDERQAAHQALAEFSFERYLASFDYWDEETRQRTGKLVKRVDLHASTLLREELLATSRTRRRRGLEMAAHLNLVSEVQDVIAAMAKDDDQFIRVEAVRILGQNPTEVSAQVLSEALSDSLAIVQEAAEQGCRELAKESPSPLPAIATTSVAHTATAS